MAQTNSKTIRVNRLVHQEKQCLSLHFPYDDALIGLAKRLNARWSRSHRCWYLPEEKSSLHKIMAVFKGQAWVDASALYGGQTPALSKKEPEMPASKAKKKDRASLPPEYKDTLTRIGYSPNTISTYVSLFRCFVEHYHPRPPDTLQEEDIKKYLLHTVTTKDLAYSTQNQIINAIKFYYEKVLRQERKTYWIERPRKERKLPEVLSKEQVEALLKLTPNIKHWCIIALLYGSGLRRSELVNLRKQDIDTDRKQLFVRGGKGKKDRVSLLGQPLVQKLLIYLEQQKPNYWVIEGNTRKQYSATSIAAVVREAGQRAGIQKKVTPHILRHSFATHLMDNGVDTRYIQKLLGHDSIKTTSIYTHVSQRDLQNISSPLDYLMDESP